jgi:hypothetical protein
MFSLGHVPKETHGLTRGKPAAPPESIPHPSSVESADFSSPKFSFNLDTIRLSTPREKSAPSRPAPGPLPYPMQAKLDVGPVSDPLEREADRIAEHVMRIPQPGAAVHPPMSHAVAGIQRKCSCGGSCDTCKAEASDDEHGQVQRKTAAAQTFHLAANRAMTAPPIVHGVLQSPGQPLDAATRAFFEPRFGRGFNNVRIHADARAADSAAAVGALAYTVGPDVVFGRGRYSPHSTAGQHLLAHELAHVIQQESAAASTLRRAPCLRGSDCEFIPGDPGRFSERVDAPPKKGEGKLTFGHAEILTPDPSDPKGGPVKPPPSRQGSPATNLRKLVENSGFKIPPEASGPFIDEGLTSEVGAQTIPCGNFPDGLPKGAPKDGCCIQVYPEMENQATRLLASKSPRTSAQEAEALQLTSTVTHEAEHCHFDDSPDTAKKIPAESGCTLDTVVFHGPGTNFDFKVKFYLSELSAEISEFPPYFQNYEKSPTKANHDLLHQKELGLVFNKDESIRGIIHGLKCACSCESVDHLIENAVHNVIDSWPKDQANKFLDVMTRTMPSWWPKNLRKL